MNIELAFKFDVPILLINGINFNGLVDVKNKNKVAVFTEEDRRHESFSQFFKRYFVNEEQFMKYGLQHMN